MTETQKESYFQLRKAVVQGYKLAEENEYSASVVVSTLDLETILDFCLHMDTCISTLYNIIKDAR